MSKRLVHNPHVGEILKTEFLDPLKLSQNALASAIGVPANRVHAIVKGNRSITADTDLRLCRFFKLSDGYWLRLQNLYELMEARREFEIKLNQIQPYVYPEDNPGSAASVGTAFGIATIALENGGKDCRK